MIAGHYRWSTHSSLPMISGSGLVLPPGGDLVRAAQRIGLKARIVKNPRIGRLAPFRFPPSCAGRMAASPSSVSREKTGRFASPTLWRARASGDFLGELLEESWSGEIILVTRRWGGAGVDPTTFGFRWFLPSIWRYRKPLAHVLIASLFVQLFALVTPLFFQIVIDKVLVHKGLSTLIVIVVGLAAHRPVRRHAAISARLCAEPHDEPHRRRARGSAVRSSAAPAACLFRDAPAGQTVARMRELETIRAFLTGQGLSSAIDLLFTIVFIAVLFVYSTSLTLIVLALDPALSPRSPS